MPLLCRDQLVLDQLGGGHVQLVEPFLVILQAVLFAFFERLERRCVAEAVVRPASEAVHMFEPAPQVLENVRFANGSPLNNPKVTSAIKLLEQKLGGGRLLVRKSGTEPVIRIMAEHENEKLMRDVVKEIAQLIRDNAA